MNMDPALEAEEIISGKMENCLTRLLNLCPESTNVPPRKEEWAEIRKLVLDMYGMANQILGIAKEMRRTNKTQPTYSDIVKKVSNLSQFFIFQFFLTSFWTFSNSHSILFHILRMS